MIGQKGVDTVVAQANARAAEIRRQSMLAPVSWLQQIGSDDRIATQRIISNAAVRSTGGVAQTVPKKGASSLSPAIILGGVVVLGAAVFLVMRARKKKK